MAGARALEGVTRTFRALGDPTRAKVVLALSIEELCVGDLARLLNASLSVVSHQLRVLRDLGLVRCRRQGRASYYSLDDELIRTLFDQTLLGSRGGTRASR
jgi:ArsR family transcriptional regulator